MVNIVKITAKQYTILEEMQKYITVAKEAISRDIDKKS